MSVVSTLIVACLLPLAASAQQRLPATPASTTTTTTAPASEPEPAEAPGHFPPLAELSARFGEPRLPGSPARATFEQQLAAINARWADATARKHALIGQVGDAKIARGDDGVQRGPDTSPAAPGALGRRVLHQDGELLVIDLFPADSPALALVDAELGALHALGGELLRGAFDIALPPAQEPGVPPVKLDCECQVTSQYTHQNDPPEGCVKSWGISYSMSAGQCDVGPCPAEEPCVGSMQVSMVLDTGHCGGQLEIDSPPGQLHWTYTGDLYTLSYDVDVTLYCGQDVTLTWIVEGVTLGETTLACNDCPAAGE